jgi:hypothetical protein
MIEVNMEEEIMKGFKEWIKKPIDIVDIADEPRVRDAFEAGAWWMAKYIIKLKDEAKKVYKEEG